MCWKILKFLLEVLNIKVSHLPKKLSYFAKTELFSYFAKIHLIYKNIAHCSSILSPPSWFIISFKILISDVGWLKSNIGLIDINLLLRLRRNIGILIFTIHSKSLFHLNKLVYSFIIPISSGRVEIYKMCLLQKLAAIIIF